MAANNQNWEKSEFPILCETCLGPNPYLRMQKLNHGAECKTCNRPFTVFRWNPNHQRAKKTEICQTCAKIKNVCQTCVLDLQFGLPVMVRDSILNVNEKLPSSDVNRQYFINKMDAQLGNESLIDYGKTDAAARELLSSISTRSEPYYARNKPHLCSFFQKGQCNRGDECPYRHENPHPDSETTSRQNIKDRFHGRKDVVAEKILNKVGLSAIPPVDRSITSLYISGVDEDMNEIDLRDYFTTFGNIKSVSLIRKANGAFINFVSRESAEEAIKAVFNNLVIKGKILRCQWSKGKGKQGQKPVAAKSTEAVVVEVPKLSSLDQLLSMPIPPPPGSVASYYPSMDPLTSGSYYGGKDD